MTRKMTTARKPDGKTPHGSPPPPSATTPLPPTRKSRTPASRLATVHRKVRYVSDQNSVLAATSGDEETKQIGRKHRSDNDVQNSLESQTSGTESKRRKTVKLSADPGPPKIRRRAPFEWERNPNRLGAIQKDQNDHNSSTGLQDKDYKSKVYEIERLQLKTDPMADATPRRSQRKKDVSPETIPAPRMTRGVNRYGFNVWVPFTEATDVTISGSEVEAIGQSCSVSDTCTSDDVSIDDNPDAAAVEPRNGVTEGSSRSYGGGVGREDVRIEAVTKRHKDCTDESSLDAQMETSGKSDFWEELKMHRASKQGNQPNSNRDVYMDDVDFTSEGGTVQARDYQNTDRKTSRCTLRGSIQGEETIAAEDTGPTTAEVSIKTPTAGSLYWRAADRLTSTGVHFFNIPVEDLREMTRLQAFEQAQKQRPRSSGELHALFISAVTDSQFFPEEYTLADSRVKLQAGRIAMYGVRLRERMATTRMLAARATQQPRDLVDRLAAIAEEAQGELAVAQKALDEDIQDVVIAKQALKNVTGVPVPELYDMAAQANTLRQNNMINEINAFIAEYGAQILAQEDDDNVTRGATGTR